MFVLFSPLGEDEPDLTSTLFQMGWNHQLVWYFIYFVWSYTQWRIIMYHVPLSLYHSVFLAATPLPHGMASVNIWHRTTSGSKLKCHRLLVIFTCSIMPPATGFSPKKPMKTASAIAASCRARLWLNLVSSTTQTRLQMSVNHCPGNHWQIQVKHDALPSVTSLISPSHFLESWVGPASQYIYIYRTYYVNLCNIYIYIQFLCLFPEFYGYIFLSLCIWVPISKVYQDIFQPEQLGSTFCFTVQWDAVSKRVRYATAPQINNQPSFFCLKNKGCTMQLLGRSSQYVVNNNALCDRKSPKWGYSLPNCLNGLWIGVTSHLPVWSSKSQNDATCLPFASAKKLTCTVCTGKWN